MGRVRLDEEKLEALRSWGERLRQASGEEYAAVGRAILMLIDEIDRLHIELWHARMQPREEEVAATDATDATTEDEEPVVSGLQARLQKVLRREVAADPVEQPAQDTEPVTTESAQAWIAALRRQR
jgi:proline racemase